MRGIGYTKTRRHRRRVFRGVAFSNVSIAAVILAVAVGCGNYPKPLASKGDIKWASRDVDDILIRRLPLKDYPLLAKFTRVRQIGLEKIMKGDEGGTDAKLQALATLNFTNLLSISLLNSHAVTDEGISALTNIRSLKQFQLEGTSITDKGCEILAAQPHISGNRSGINVANCPEVTIRGLRALAGSNLNSLTFSAISLSQSDIIDLIDSFKTITWCEIVDTEDKLDARAIQRKGAGKSIQMVVSSKGALQWLPK